jgi:hypothetical protein
MQMEGTAGGGGHGRRRWKLRRLRAHCSGANCPRKAEFCAAGGVIGHYSSERTSVNGGAAVVGTTVDGGAAAATLRSTKLMGAAA